MHRQFQISCSDAIVARYTVPDHSNAKRVQHLSQNEACKKNWEGGCRCGAVRYRMKAEQLPVTYACHCLDCQTWSGSAFSQQSICRESDFTYTGQIAQFDLASADGQRISHQFACPQCFTRVFNSNSARPGRVVIRAGTFDASDQLRLVAHIWIRRMQSWVILEDATPRWSEGAPVDEFHHALGIPVTG
jgi:hypothetical protein